MVARRHLRRGNVAAGARRKRVLEIGPAVAVMPACSRNTARKSSSPTSRRSARCRRAVSSLMQARKGFNADAENLPFRDNAFDIVYSNGVLHHSWIPTAVSRGPSRACPGRQGGDHAVPRHSAIFRSTSCRASDRRDFPLPEAQVGRLTEGREIRETKNPFTRVYSKTEIRKAFRAFRILSLRKSSFQFDNVAVPKLSQIRRALLSAVGRKPHRGGVLVYGTPYMNETALELALGPVAGFSWNIVAEKPADGNRPAGHA